ncbi:MAG: hypothetical protein ACTSPY_16060 [Candidatus Helarchaeota archaeon]
MKNLNQFILNIITIFSFVLYAIGIYLHVAILGEEWGNVAVDLAISLVGAIWGVIFVVLIGSLILLITFFIDFLKKTNIFLCFFWILSLYQCAINSFLQFYGMPDEPINQFFKLISPNFWYPIKEICFILISLALTILWVKKISKSKFNKIDILLISLVILVMISGTLFSQLFLIN